MHGTWWKTNSMCCELSQDKASALVLAFINFIWLNDIPCYFEWNIKTEQHELWHQLLTIICMVRKIGRNQNSCGLMVVLIVFFRVFFLQDSLKNWIMIRPEKNKFFVLTSIYVNVCHMTSNLTSYPRASLNKKGFKDNKSPRREWEAQHLEGLL